MNSFDAHENNDITFVHVQESNNILNCPISEEEIYIYMYSKSAKITTHGRVEISLIGLTRHKHYMPVPSQEPVIQWTSLFTCLLLFVLRCLNRLGRLLYFMNLTHFVFFVAFYSLLCSMDPLLKAIR